MKHLIQKHRVYICGFISGCGLGVLSVEAFRSNKNPLYYLGGLSLMALGSALYHQSKTSEK
jgi:hypothetical protein